MTLLLVVCGASFLLAAGPLALFLVNLLRFRAPPLLDHSATAFPRVSLLIPARDEEASIGPCLEAALSSRGIELEVVVLDDESRDGTAGVVREIAARDPRVRLARANPLPNGWCGKQHACATLAQLARHDLLAFIDADVRLEPEALARAARFQSSGGAALVSGFPRQQTGTLLEKLLVPLVHLILLGYLPMGRMRSTLVPAYGAGCGQFFLATREGYARAGGHAAIRETLHDGIMLPRAFRRAGLATDIFDATGLATCRMYVTNRAVWDGLSKNATEGMASPGAIGVWTILLLGGHVLPAMLVPVEAAVHAGESSDAHAGPALAFATAALLASLGMRLIAALRFRQSIAGALLHPLGVLTLVVIQWHALFRKACGRPTAWRGRAYPFGTARVSSASTR